MSYVKTEWQTGDLITADKINKIEDGIEVLSECYEELKGDLGELESGNLTWLQGYYHLTNGSFVSNSSYWCTRFFENVDFNYLDDKGIPKINTNTFYSLRNGNTFVGTYWVKTGIYKNASNETVSNIDYDSWALCLFNEVGVLKENIILSRSIRGNINNRWYKKNGGFLGDSITYGAYTPVGSQGMNPTERAEKPYCSVVGEILNMNVTNYGVSGTTICDFDGNHSSAFVHRYATMRNDLDLICVMGGCNDHLLNVPMGTIADVNNASTFYGALHLLCANLITKYPNGRIVFITPIHRNPGAEVANSVGKTLEEYRQAIRDVARGYYGLKIIEGTELGVNAALPIYRSTYIVDGTHPNPILHQLIGENLAQELNSI